jgi:hypothetical protein
MNYFVKFSQLCLIFLSITAGWHPECVAEAPRNPTMAIDINGNIVAVWLSQLETCRTVVNASTLARGRGEWAPLVTLSPDNTNAFGSPQIVMNESGDAGVVWVNYLPDLTNAVMMAALLPATGSWNVVQISSSKENAHQDFQLKITCAGELGVTWTSNDADQNYFINSSTSRFDGTWSSPIKVASH